MSDTNEQYDSRRPVVLVGYSPGVLAAIARVLPERSVVVVDEPDVLRKRNAYEVSKSATVLRELVGWEYLRDHAADCFYLAHRDWHPVAVVPVIDYSVPFAARLAERYQVPGAGYGAGLILRNKDLQRPVTAAAGIANPRSEEVAGPAEVRSLMRELAGPVVLKPANRQGAIGTKILRDPGEVAAVWEECLDQDEGIYVPDRPMPLRMLVEEFIEGEEFSVELVVRHGQTVFAAPTRKYLFGGPRPVEQGHLHPADVDPALYDRLVADTERVIDAVGMDTGLVHCEWMVRDGTPYFIECAGRPAGDMIIELVEMAWDYDIVREFYQLMRGLPLAETQAAQPPRYAAVWTTQASSFGVIAQVEGVAQAEAAPGVRTVIHEEVGDRAHPLRSSDDRLTMVTASGDTPAAALDNARHAAELIKFTTAPDSPPPDRVER